QGLYDFFGQTFCANQYGSEMIQPLVGKALLYLHKEKMIHFGKTFEATAFGHRVSELYVDPLSAVSLRDSLQKRANHLTNFSFLHMVCHTPDVYPKTYPRRREIDALSTFVDRHSDEFTVPIPEMWDNVAFGIFLGEVKAATVLESWIRETSEDAIIERFSVLPGDLFRLADSVDWLLYASTEIGRLFGHRDLLPQLDLLRTRVTKGVKQEILPLVKLRGIGRIRGRMLFNAGFTSIQELKRASLEQLTSIPTIGPQIAHRIKEQVGGYVKAEKWAQLKSRELREQASIAEY
ncbi:MAG: hypothetical protein JSV76_06225, partial [Candidatus Bathyarchaeota archaeon]